MAASKSYLARQNYRFLPVDLPNHHHHHLSHHDSSFELDECDIYDRHHHAAAESPEFRKAGSRIGGKNRPTVAAVKFGSAASSLPVNIPDWSKILKDEYRDNQRRDPFDDDEEEELDDDYADGGGVRVPPHEFLARQMARTRIASFSVHEGVGRTLKGRDLSRVRNAIWEKTGFQD
ncbi:unnamed protein product [Linum tenue]|uniref:Senescence regulator n=1 Tax=Linum tenue TaxID=586396 RepID=A0AAV0IJU8_9ROSI|nr:unnamed protein product [Linum tenue]